jgi:hypothetical protein
LTGLVPVGRAGRGIVASGPCPAGNRGEPRCVPLSDLQAQVLGGMGRGNRRVPGTGPDFWRYLQRGCSPCRTDPRGRSIKCFLRCQANRPQLYGQGDEGGGRRHHISLAFGRRALEGPAHRDGHTGVLLRHVAIRTGGQRLRQARVGRRRGEARTGRAEDWPLRSALGLRRRAGRHGLGVRGV